jgi:hypothetical protein
MSYFFHYIGIFLQLASNLIMVVSAPTEDANFDEAIYVGGMERDLRGGKGIYSSIGLIIGTVGCFCSALYCCIRIARKEAVLRNGIRIPGIKLSEDQRRAILEFLFPGNVSIKLYRKNLLILQRTLTMLIFYVE